MEENRQLTLPIFKQQEILQEIVARMPSTDIIRETVRVANQLDLSKEIHPQDVARACGFDGEEIQLLETFASQLFTNGRVYLAPEFIKSYLVGGHTPDKLTNFYKDTLRSKYITKQNYFELDVHNPTDKKFIDAYYSSINREKSRLIELSQKRRGAPSKYYYAVSWHCYQDLIMQSSTPAGKQLRAYHIKLQSIIPIYNQLLNFAQIIILQQQAHIQEITCRRMENEHKQAIEDVHAQARAREDAAIQAARDAQARASALQHEAEQMRARQVRMKALSFPNIAHDASGYFYIATCPTMARNSHYKIGYTSNLQHRLEAYQTGRPSTDAYYFAYICPCANAYRAEQYIKALLHPYRENSDNDTELFVIRFKYLRDIVDAVLQGTLGAINVMRVYTERREDVCSNDEDVPAAVTIPVTQCAKAAATTGAAARKSETPEEARRRLLSRVLNAFGPIATTSDASSSSSGPSTIGSTREVDEDDSLIKSLIAELQADKHAARALGLIQRRTIKTLLTRILESTEFELTIRKIHGARGGSRSKKYSLRLRANATNN